MSAADPPSTGPKVVVPYIPASKVLPELTVGVVLLGSLLSVILAGANAYLGMFAGMTVSASVPAAVLSMAILRALRTGNILQNNGVQTAAASGEGLAAGVIFTLPALVILGTWSRQHGADGALTGNAFPYLETTLIAGFGGLLGVLFTIPLRRALIIDQPLQFPEGVATAEVLKVGAEGGGGVGVLVVAGVVGALVKIGAAGLALWAEVVEFGTYIAGKAALGTATVGGPTAGVPAYFGLNASPALLSVGYIVGFNVAVVIFAGAALNRWVALPLFAAFGDPFSIIIDPDAHAQMAQVALTHAHAAPLYGTLAEALKDSSAIHHILALVDPHHWIDHRLFALDQPLPDVDAVTAAGVYHKYVTRYLGVGGMLVGGMWSLFKLRTSLLGGIKAGLDAYKRGREGGPNTVPRTERDMPMNIILGLIALSVVPLFFIFWHLPDITAPIAAIMAVVMLVAGFLFAAVASYMAGLVGSSNNPVSGITISTILVSALLLLALGVDSEAGPVAAILIGAIVCCAAAIGGDNMQDLKCGQLVGSTPWKQQVMQIIGVVIAAFAMAPILNLLNNAYGIGSEKLAAPQANLMGTVAKGVFAGGLPWTFIAIGAVIAAVVIAIDVALDKRGSKFRIPVMAFAVGVYLPFELNVPIFFGGVVAWLVSRVLDKTKASPERRATVERNGLLAAAGFITGEALIGIALAIPVAATQNDKVLALAGGEYADFKVPSLVFVALALTMLYKLALRREPTSVAPPET